MTTIYEGIHISEMKRYSVKLYANNEVIHEGKLMAKDKGHLLAVIDDLYFIDNMNVDKVEFEEIE